MLRDGDNKNRMTIRLEDATLKRIDSAMRLDRSKSRNEFIETAINHYAGILLLDANQNVLADSIERLVRGIVKDSENRIARLQFKEAVELAKLAHIIAYTSDVDAETLSSLHKKCVDEVKKINGTVSFEEAFRYQKS